MNASYLKNNLRIRIHNYADNMFQMLAMWSTDYMYDV